MDLISRQKNNRGKTLSGAPTVLQYTLDELKKEVNSYKHKKDYYQDFMLFWKQKDIKEIMASKY
jgi:hypothetical protein